MASISQKLDNNEKKLDNVQDTTNDIYKGVIALHKNFDEKVGQVIDAVYEASEVEVPSSFIILPNLLPTEAEASTAEKEAMELVQLAGNLSIRVVRGRTN